MNYLKLAAANKGDNRVGGTFWGKHFFVRLLYLFGLPVKGISQCTETVGASSLGFCWSSCCCNNTVSFLWGGCWMQYSPIETLQYLLWGIVDWVKVQAILESSFH